MPLLLAALALWAASLRHIYAVGRTWNDHAVAAVVSGCFGFYLGLARLGPGWFVLPALSGMVGLWGLFAAIHREDAPPPWLRRLAVLSQPAYAFALWGGLFALIRLPWAVVTGAPLGWPGLALLPAAILSALGAGETHRHGAGRVTRHRVPGLPLRLVQLSDPHASPLMHEAALDRMVEATNALAPDLVVITGDLLMPFSEREHGYLLRALARLRAPWLACPGNHDLPVLDALRAELGERLLVDAQVRLASGPIEVLGVNFTWLDAREALRRTLDALPRSGAFRVLLAHDPRLGRWMTASDADLVLSGHTHGGQVAGNMLGFAASILRPLGVRDQGWFRGDGPRHYVHAGNWVLGLPPRMGIGPEIALFEPEAP